MVVVEAVVPCDYPTDSSIHLLEDGLGASSHSLGGEYIQKLLGRRVKMSHKVVPSN